MDIRAFTAMGIIQQAISNQVSTLHTTTPDSAQNSQKPRAERSVPDTLQPAALKGPDSATRPTAATGRPAGDRRTAEEIINANPTLKNLEMRQGIYKHAKSRPLPEDYKQGIYKRTGDWTTANKNPDARADAAYNAARLFNFIDSKDAHTVLASQHDDGFLSGYYRNEKVVPYHEQFPDVGKIVHDHEGERLRVTGYPPFRSPSIIQKDSEHALLTKFIEQGYSSLDFKGEQQIYVRPTHATGRPRGDQRSAEDILRDNPLLAAAYSTVDALVKLGENLKDYQRHTGDWSRNNKDPEARADAAYNLAYITNYIDNLNKPTNNTGDTSPSFNEAQVWVNDQPSTKSHMLQITLLNGYESLTGPDFTE